MRRRSIPQQLPCCSDTHEQLQALVVKDAAPVAAQGTAFAQKQKQKVAWTPATKGNYNKEYFADKECHNCSKKGHPARYCPKKKGMKKKDSEDDKSVSSA